MKHVPPIDGRYWTTLVIASVTGANIGDFLSDVLDLGHVSGLPVLALVLTAIFLTEARTRVSSPFFYWGAILTIRAAATNIGDCLHDLGVNFTQSVPIVFALECCWLALWQLTLRRRGSSGPIPVDTSYWISMGLVGVLGTLVGDAMSYAVGLGNLWATIALGAGVALLLIGGGGGRMRVLAYYWLTIALIRSAGTAAGDLLAHQWIGLPASTAASVVILIGTIAAFDWHRSERATADRA